MSRIHFDVPEDWEMSYEAGDEDGVDENGDYVDTAFTENLYASAKDGKESFDVHIPHYYAPVDIREDIMLPEVIEYLDNSGFIIPEYLAPDPEDLIHTCQICGREGYYYLMQEPNQESATLRIMFSDPEDNTVFIYARLSFWRNDDQMIAFLAEHLSFQ